ncbi:MAG: hypothetical protein ACRDIB_15495, partial [Ardenticatenaceae bacterium]
MVNETAIDIQNATELSQEELIERVVRLGFGGDWERYDTFVAKLRAGLPEGTEVALRGSVVTNERHNGGCFDEGGPGTSDLDVTLIGKEVMDLWDKGYFYVPRVNTKPLSDEQPEAAPALNDLRMALQEIAGRPVNFQAMSELFLEGRERLADQPYVKIIEGEG